MYGPSLNRLVNRGTLALGILLAGALSSSVLAAPSHAPQTAPSLAPVLSPAAAGDPVIVYVANSSSASVSVVDLSTLAEVGTIPVGNGASTLAVSPDGKTAYVGHRNDNSVGVIDTISHTMVYTISAGIGSFPDGLSLSPDGERLYVSNRLSHSISVIDTTSFALVDTFSAISHPLSGSVTPDGSRLYVPNWGDNSVSSFDTSSGASTRIPVGVRPLEAAMSPDGSEVYVTAVDSDEVSVIDTATDSVVATISTPRPFGTAFSPDGSRAYVPGGSSAPTYVGTLSVIDTATRGILTSTGVGALGNFVAADPAGATVLVPNRFSNDLSVIDTATNLEIGRVPVGAAPLDVAYVPHPAEVCFKIVDNVGLGGGDRFTAWTPASGEGLARLRRLDDDILFMTTAGDPVPGIDVAIEQIPGGAIQHMIAVPSSDGRPTFVGVTPKGVVITAAQNVDDETIEFSATYRGEPFETPVVFGQGPSLTPSEMTTLLRVDVAHHERTSQLHTGLITRMVTELRHAQEAIDRGQTGQAVRSLKRFGAYAAIVGDPVPGIDVAIEQVPGSSMMLDDAMAIIEELEN